MNFSKLEKANYEHFSFIKNNTAHSLLGLLGNPELKISKEVEAKIVSLVKDLLDTSFEKGKRVFTSQVEELKKEYSEEIRVAKFPRSSVRPPPSASSSRAPEAPEETESAKKTKN